MIDPGDAEEVFGMGAVVHRTGLTAQGIRMWEKRYDAVVPKRNDTNRRLYSRTDVERLALMKQLTDAGHSISSIANLGLSQLQDLMSDLGESPSAAPVTKPLRNSNRVLIVGSGLASALEADTDLEFEMLPVVEDLSGALHGNDLPQTDLLLIETETVFAETQGQVEELMERSGAGRALVIFRFASRKDELDCARSNGSISLLRGPVDAARLRRECYLQLRVMQATPYGGPPLDTEPIPERLFDAQHLARLARIDSAVNCECPRHLAELLKSLSAFEAYSEGCEDRNAEDAMVHSYLHRTTAQVRRTMEDALQHLLKAEGISLD
jgi:DNA-binding transcriptional MerR regulator